MSLRMILS